MTALQTAQQLDHTKVVSELIEKYLVFKEDPTKGKYRTALHKFFEFVESEGVTKIMPDTIHSYKINLESRGLKVNTINSYLAPIKNFFKWAFDMDYLAYDPSKYLRNSKQTNANEIKKARALTSQEVMAILNATSKDSLKAYSERIMLLCMFNLGLRVHEVMNLKLSDIDIDKGIINILGKGRKIRTLGTNSVLLSELKAYITYTGFTDDNYLINTVQGGINVKPGTPQHGNNVLKRTAQRANIDLTGISSHSGRVTAINHLLDSDVPLRDVANFAGHADVNTTRIYDRKSTAKVVETCNILSFGSDE